MTRDTEIARAVRYAILMGAVAVASATSLPAQAQVQAQATDQEATTLTTVVVTGSRIPQPNLESISAVTAVSAEQIKEQGTTRIEDLLNQLPQVMADFGGNLTNAATGASTVNLRGLGASRTLVLVDGRRLMPGDPTQNGNEAPDLNQIPAALVQRIEVLTGGASAVYGADAVAGVVNFIMNDHFEGVRIDANYNFYQHSQSGGPNADAVTAIGFQLPPNHVTDGYGKDVTLLMGSNFADGKGNVTVYAGYRNLQGVLQGARDFSACELGSGTSPGCIGSSTSVPGRFGLNPEFTIGAGNTLVPFKNPGSLYNFAPSQYFQRPDERYTAGAFGHLKFNDHVEAYTEFMFMDDRTHSQVGPAGAFAAFYQVNCNNPYLQQLKGAEAAFCTGPDPLTGATLVPNGPELADIFIGRRNVEGGPRIDDLIHTSYRSVIGLRGEIAEGWNYDVYGQYGTTRLTDNHTGDFSITHLNNAFQVVTEAGQNICRANAAGANGAPGCAPYNIFTLGGVTPAALSYVSTPGLIFGSTTERVVEGSVTGDLGKYGAKSPWAKDGLALNVGSTYRQEKSELFPDQEQLSGDLAGQGGPTQAAVGQFHVWEGFGEVHMPILQDMPFAKSLDVEGGYRYSSYQEGFSTNTYKLGLEWAPVRDFRIRGTYQKAVRAPNIQELFRPSSVQLDSSIGSDPCSVGTPGQTPQDTLVQCERSGVTPAQYGQILGSPAAQYNGLQGGNRNLLPETSVTRAAGIVFTPTFLPGFSASIDFFDITVENYINGLGAQNILNNCLSTGEAALCSLVHRDVTGSLWATTNGFVVDTTLNTGSLFTRGWDLAVDYRLDMGHMGRLIWNLVGTYTQHLETQSFPGGPSYDCAGLFGATCGVPAPKWRHNFRSTWQTPIEGLEATATWRRIGSVNLDLSSSNPLLAGPVAPTDATLGKRDYLDLTAAYTFAKQYTVRLGVNNVTDKDPPVTGANSLPGVLGSGNTFPQVYDTLGRFVFVNLTLDF
jgi:iron complex outermembrane receptor protein